MKTKTLLTISCISNVCLGVCLFHFWPVHHAMKTISSPQVVAEASVSVQPAPVSLPPATTLSESEPFRWSQLESATDYRLYVKNLRDAGCPKQTLRDIVTGNVDRAFSAERRRLNLDGNEPTEWSLVAEEQLINQLLGETDDSALAKQSADGQDPGHPPISIPLVMQKVDLDALGLNDDQKEVIARIQQQFIEAIGGPYQDPNDSAYLQRWQKAQPESDDMLKGMLGSSIFENYQLAAANSKQGN
jgi:hypothetical protein